jgi:hypothetical protein
MVLRHTNLREALKERIKISNRIVDPWVHQAADVFIDAVADCTDLEVLKEVGRRCIQSGATFRAEESIRGAIGLTERQGNSMASRLSISFSQV